MDELLHSFIRQAPVAVMVRAALARALADSTLDELFERTAQSQYTRELTFSARSKLLAKVTFGTHKSIHAACRLTEGIPTSLSAVYQKLQGVEPAVLEALVQQTAERLAAVRSALPLPAAAAGPAGLRVRMLDGNFLAGTDRRLACLRGSGAAALPGMALVVRDDPSGLLTDLIPCEDAYTNERALAERFLPRVRPEELWLMDRNFCTADYLGGIQARGAFFLVRHHAGTHLQALGAEVAAGSNASGDVSEQEVLAGRLRCRLIRVRLFGPLRDGATEVRLLTNVPRCQAGAAQLAELSRRRWSLETSFQELTVNLRCEVNTLGYPKAALFAFALAVVAYNALVVVQSAVAAGQGQRRAEVSTYYLGAEVAAVSAGMAMVLPGPFWERYARMSVGAFAAWLLGIARELDGRRYRKAVRGPKQPVQVQRGKRGGHRSTARELLKQKKPPSKG
jgi:hypothetical protein